jgi:NADH:ubiquinone oxidoreductase subunit K
MVAKELCKLINVFSLKRTAMQVITVTTKEQLEAAKNQKYEQIIVQGALADTLKKSKAIAVASGSILGVLAALLAALPFTGGVSALGVVPIAALTGFEIAAIIAAIAVGLALIIAVFKEYDEIHFKKGELILRRKKN